MLVVPWGVWQSRQAWFSEASGFCGRLGWWQVVQAMRSLPGGALTSCK